MCDWQKPRGVSSTLRARPELSTEAVPLHTYPPTPMPSATKRYIHSRYTALSAANCSCAGGGGRRCIKRICRAQAERLAERCRKAAARSRRLVAIVLGKRYCARPSCSLSHAQCCCRRLRDRCCVPPPPPPPLSSLCRRKSAEVTPLQQARPPHTLSPAQRCCQLLLHRHCAPPPPPPLPLNGFGCRKLLGQRRHIRPIRPARGPMLSAAAAAAACRSAAAARRRRRHGYRCRC
eukprot:TRINITY_DN3158_c0_g2_i3.p1 TRINITY_DN3158_c0_g2~~TRINITY_DN3158_c0_g2_i3.p1  ORF type:complete len:234 (+),score=38.51 TRINITY_DN3158_c0_g2_i3:675-1376(+)